MQSLFFMIVFTVVYHNIFVHAYHMHERVTDTISAAWDEVQLTSPVNCCYAAAAAARHVLVTRQSPGPGSRCPPWSCRD